MPASITLTVSHLATSTSFFLSILHPLNYVYRGRVNNTVGFGHPDAAPDFWITQSIPGVPPGAAHVAFPATSRGKVHDFFHTALKAGGRVHGEPALRDECGYYSAAVIDFDGNSIEAVFRPDLLEDNKENIASADTKSVISVAQSVAKSVAKSQAVSIVSSASKATSVATKSVATKSVALKSIVPSVVSAAPKSTVSMAPSRAPSQSTRAITYTVVSNRPGSVAAPAPASEAPARTIISRAPTAPVASPTVMAHHPNAGLQGGGLADMINEARGTISLAREMVNQARPLISSAPVANAAAAVTAAGEGTGSSPDSHGPSDAIVGTLLGVAAGAALHYAFSNRNKKPVEAAPAAAAPLYAAGGIARSETAPSYREQRYYYYHQPARSTAKLPASGCQASEAGTYATPYDIEAPLSDVSRSYVGGQKLIELVDHDEILSEVAPSAVRPQRRSSFSGASAVRTAVSRATNATATNRSGLKVLDDAPALPPTSYRAPTAITMQSETARSGSKLGRGRRSSFSIASSRHSSTHRSHHSGHPRREDEGYGSATEDHKSKAGSKVSRASRASRHTQTQEDHHHHHHHHRSSSRAPSGAGSSSNTTVTAIRSPENIPLPGSRAASLAGDNDRVSFISARSKAAKTVIGRLTETQLQKLEAGGRLEKGNSDVTRSVISKVKEADRVSVSAKEIRPEDSVSQVSSSRGSRRSGH